MINPKIMYWTFSLVLLATFIMAIVSIAKSSKDGNHGEHGDHGKHGKHGIGIDGNHGNHGNDGYEGYNGYDGNNGYDGSHGYDGDNGDDGINGYDGNKGGKGLPGTDAPNMYMSVCPEGFWPLNPLNNRDYGGQNQSCEAADPDDNKNATNCTEANGTYDDNDSTKYCTFKFPIKIKYKTTNGTEVKGWLHRQDLVPPSVYT